MWRRRKYYVSYRINDDDDDVEEDEDGDVGKTSSDLELVNDSGTGSGDQHVGLRFNGVAVPAGATMLAHISILKLMSNILRIQILNLYSTY